VDQLVLVFSLCFAAILAEPLSRRVKVSAPILMTLFGIVLALIPSIPNIHINPELILPLVLPPLLYAAARRTQWRQFVAAWAPILARAVFLVVATTAAVAFVFHQLQPAVPIGAAVTLGALVAPPDPVAATAVASPLGLPRRLVSVLEGEGMFNDVTAIVIYTVAVEAVRTGRFSTSGAVGEFLLSAAVAVAAGVVIGWLATRIMRWLDDVTLKVALSLLVPFAAYGIADALEGSGVLGVLVCSLYLTDAVADSDDVSYRLVGGSFWDITELLVSGFAFGLIGLELSTVLSAVGSDWGRLLGDTAVIIAVVVLLRLVWLLVTWFGYDRTRKDREADAPYSWQETLVTWWAGMRGVATVALALALPLTTDRGSPFPARDAVLFAAFGVVLFTLLAQGLTLPVMVRLTGVRADTQAERRLERELWIRVRKAQLERLREVADEEGMPDDIYEQMHARLTQRLAEADPEAAGEDDREAMHRKIRWVRTLRRVQQDIMAAGRREAMAARGEPGMPPDLVDRVMRRLDLVSAR
jgi:CPA1 family monovalent cation:H+ antiporter